MFSFFLRVTGYVAHMCGNRRTSAKLLLALRLAAPQQHHGKRRTKPNLPTHSNRRLASQVGTAEKTHLRTSLEPRGSRFQRGNLGGERETEKEECVRVSTTWRSQSNPEKVTH